MTRPFSSRERFLIGSTILIFTAIMLAMLSPVKAQDAAAKAEAPFVQVDGEASQDVAPDFALLSLGAVSDGATAEAASKANFALINPVLDTLKAEGIAPEDIKTVQVNVSPVFNEGLISRAGSSKRSLDGYRAVYDVEVKIRDVGKAGALVGKLLKDGANVVNGLSYGLSKREDMLDTLRGKAVINARHRAELFAGGAGLKLGRLLRVESASDAGGEPVPQMRAMAYSKSDSGAAPIVMPLQPGTIHLSVSTRAAWELVP